MKTLNIRIWDIENDAWNFVLTVPSNITQVEIVNILKKEHIINFSSLFDKKEKDYIIVTFLSILEMVKDNTLKIEQKHNFDEIILSLESK